MAKQEKRGFWSKIFGKTKSDEPFRTYSLADILNGVTPIYTSDSGADIYASDVVQQCVYAIVKELKKLDPMHVRKLGTNDYIPITGNIQNVLEDPNPLMSTTDFIEKIAWTLLLNYNAFVYPVWEGDNLVALYPLQPTLVEFDNNYGGTGKTWVRLHFRNGYSCDVPYENIIHLRYKFSVSEFMGGNEQGQPDFAPLAETLKLNDTLLRGLAKSLNIQTAINGIAKLKSMHNTAEQIALVKEFEQKLQANESGILPLDVSAEYTPIAKQVQLLDATTLEFIDKKIVRWFGASIPIIDGVATPEEREAFYQTGVEHIVKTFNQAFTKGILSKRRVQGFKQQIVFFPQEVYFSSMSQKLEAAKLIADTESGYKNEVRWLLGMRPDMAFAGQIASSSNKTNAENNKQGEGAESGLASGENGNGGTNNGET